MTCDVCGYSPRYVRPDAVMRETTWGRVCSQTCLILARAGFATPAAPMTVVYDELAPMTAEQWASLYAWVERRAKHRDLEVRAERLREACDL